MVCTLGVSFLSINCIYIEVLDLGAETCRIKPMSSPHPTPWGASTDGPLAHLNPWFEETFTSKWRLSLTIKTSNSSRHLKGDSIVPHSAVRKEMVESDLSPPDKDFMTDVLWSTFFSEYSCLGCLWTSTCDGKNDQFL